MNDSQADDQTLGVKRKIRLLTWVGVAFYIIGDSIGLLNAFLTQSVHFGYLFFYLALCGIGIWIFLQIGKYKNWARRTFMILFVVFSLPVFPLMFLGPSSIVWFSSSSQMSFVTWLVSILLYLFSSVLLFYLFKAPVRKVFSSEPPKTYQRVLLGIGAGLFLLLGIGIYSGLAFVDKYVYLEDNQWALTAKSKQNLGVWSDDSRRVIGEALGVHLPASGGIYLGMQDEPHDWVVGVNLETAHVFAVLMSNQDRYPTFDDLVQTVRNIATEEEEDTDRDQKSLEALDSMNVRHEVMESVTLSVLGQALQAEHLKITFQDGGGKGFDGRVLFTNLDVGERPIAVVSFSISFPKPLEQFMQDIHPEHLETFLSEWLAENWVEEKGEKGTVPLGDTPQTMT